MLNTLSENSFPPASEMLWLYDRAMGATSTGIVIADAGAPNRPLIYCNAAFERMTGYSREETLGRNCSFLQGADTDPKAVEEIRLALREERECQVILKNYRKDGTPFWNELTISPVRDSNGKLSHFIGVQNDITQRVQAETELKHTALELARSEAAFRKQTQILQSILDSLAEGVIVADETGKFLLFNPGAEQILGQGLIEIPPQQWSEKFQCYLSDEKTPYPSEKLPLTLAIQGQEVDGAEVVISKNQTSENICISVNARPLKDEEGNLKGGVAVFRNITEHKKAERALRQSEAQLREQATQLKQALEELQETQTQLIQSEKMSSLGQLVAGIAHEINNPVSFIYGNLAHANEYIRELVELLHLYRQYSLNPVSEILAKIESIDLEFLLEDLPKLLSSMKQGAERIRQIVVSLRNFSRLDEAEMKSVDIHSGIDSTLLILQHRLAESINRPGIQVVKEYGDLPLVECNAGQLNQVFMNILNNAIDAIEEKCKQSNLSSGVAKEKQNNYPTHIPEIRIRTRLAENRVIIKIADNGIGMNEEVLWHLFEPFFTTKQVGKGTGLGLSISYQIVVQKHGGKLNCISAPGEGTEFIIDIPYRHPDNALPNLTKVPPSFQKVPAPAVK